MEQAKDPSGTGKRDSGSRWNYTPPLPVTTSPYFSWPPDLIKIGQWIIGGWFPLSERLIILLLAILCSVFFQPGPESTQSVSPGWILDIFLRNFCLMFLVAGGLHWYFYIARKQGDTHRYDTRPFASKSRVFTFGSQVRDNMFWTLASGVTVWTMYECLMLWALSNGYAPTLLSTLSPSLSTGEIANTHGTLLQPIGHWLLLAMMVLLIPAWETTHFFLIHRLIHTSKLYQRIHALHHRNTNVGPWSGLSMHPVEHIIYLSTVLIHFVVPSTPFLIAFHLMYFTLSAATTHTGYRGILYNGRTVLPLGTFHHQLHHRYFTCNYGGLEVPWDQWTGSFHDGTTESHENFLNKRRKSL